VADYNIKGEMTLSTGSFISSAKAASNSLNGINGASSKAGAGVNILGGIMKKVAMGAIATYAIKLGRDSVKAAQEAGVAQFRLTTLLKTASNATNAQIATINAQADALAKVTVVSKENIQTVQSQLATFNLHTGAIEKLTPAILDYVTAEKGAAAGSEEYRNMTNGLALALNGNFGALSRVGFVLDDATKKQISSGTEMERAAAIAKVLNSTYKDYAITVGDTAAGAQQKLANQANNLKQSFGEMLLPVIQKVQMFIGNTLMPAIQGLMEKFKDGSGINAFISFVGSLLKNLYDFGSAIVSVVGPLLMNILVPAFSAVVAAIVGVIRVLGAVGNFIKSNVGFFRGLVTVLAVAALAYSGLYIGIGIYNAVAAISIARTKLMTAWTNRQAIATGILTVAQNGLNMMMALNPIGLMIAAAILLIAVFVGLWNKSESFRKMMIQVGKAGVMGFGYLIKIVGVLLEGLVKVVTGPMRLLLKGLSLLGVDAAGKALTGIDKMTSGIGDFFDKAGNKVQDFADKLDGLANKKFSLPKFSLPKGAKTPGKKDDPNNNDGTGGGAGALDQAAKDLAKKLSDLKEKLGEVVQDYNDFILNDFAAGFVKGSETARDTMLKGLDELKKVFDAKKDIFEAKGDTAGLAKIKTEFDKINAYVRGRIQEAMAIADALEKVSAQLEEAEKRLARAIEERSASQKKFSELLAQPFGEPSKITKGMASAESTVESIISMYDELITVIDQRFTDLAPGARDAVKNYLYAQTNGLIDAARNRVKAIKALEVAQKRLDDLIDTQKQFGQNLTSSLKSFATAVADLSKADGAATFTVIKTATGLVITQLKQSTSGIDTITNQLKARLETITAFATNANKLLASGLNREYVRQLLEAGPEAAGAAVAALANATASQIAEINSLYSQIGTMSDTFGSATTEKMYGEAVGMATSFRDGAALGVELINAQMTDIVSNISAILGVLGNTGLTSAAALIDALVAEFTRQASVTVGPATQAVVDKIKTTLEALGGVGTVNGKALMDGLVTATGGTNLVLVTGSATAVNKGITDALASLKTLGTELAKDLAQGMFDQLTLEKARLVTLANEIAAAIAAAMAAAAASIGVTVSGQITPNPGGGPEVTPKPEPDTTPKAEDVPKAVDTPKVVTPPTVAKVAAAAEKYVVKSGDTLSAIAKANGTTLKAVLAANPKFTDVAKYQNGNMIWSGTTVNIPAPKVATAAPASGGGFTDSQNAARIASQTTTIEKGAISIYANGKDAAAVIPEYKMALLEALAAR